MIRNVKYFSLIPVSCIVPLVLFTALGCGGPQYPNCESDDHCKENPHGKPERCVNQQCQACMSAAECPADHICNGGKCELEPECSASKACPEGKKCDNSVCVDDWECTKTEDCGNGKVCNEATHKCDAASCVSAQECGAGFYCSDGLCMAGEDPNLISAAWAGQCSLSEGSDASQGTSAAQFRVVAFDFDKADIRPDMESVMESDGGCLNAMMESGSIASIRLEGHADDRGTPEYNLALGEDRAKQVQDWLQTRYPALQGKFQVHSWGEEKPICQSSGESCWEENRRVEFFIE